MRGIIDRKGEQFGYIIGADVFTMDDELSGKLTKTSIVDLAGNVVWRIIGDGVYRPDNMEPIGFLSSNRADSARD